MTNFAGAAPEGAKGQAGGALVGSAAVWVVLAIGWLVAAGEVGAQPAMEQGRAKLILQQTEQIRAEATKQDEAVKQATPKLQGLRAQADEQQRRAGDETLGAAERERARANALASQAALVREMNTLAREGVGRFARIVEAMEVIEREVQADPVMSGRGTQVAGELTEQVHAVAAADGALLEVLGDQLEGVPAQEAREYRNARSRHMAAYQARQAMQERMKKIGFGDGIRTMRQMVISQMNHYEMLRRQTEKQQAYTTAVALFNSIALAGARMARQLEGLVTASDPLAIAALQPGRELELLETFEVTPAGGAKAAPAMAGLSREDFLSVPENLQRR